MNFPNTPATASNANDPISPEIFWGKFYTALRLNWNPEVDVFWFKDLTKRTKFMTDVLKKLAPAFNCHCDCEYWPRVDVSYFDRATGTEWMEWSREAAIELENGDSWTNEVCKLMEINAGIKILIAYVDNQKKLDDFWPRLTTIYASRKYVTKPCSWLFIFRIYRENNWNFVAFKFDGATQTEITGNV